MPRLGSMIIPGIDGEEGVNILTPLDDPTQFSPTWRAEIAFALRDRPRYKLPKPYDVYNEDKYIRDYITFIRRVGSKSNMGPVMVTPIGYAYNWYNQESIVDTRYKLEPLLLTQAPYGTIDKVLSGGSLGEEPYKTYEKLFFNIRDDEGKLSKSCHLRMWFALPNESDALNTGELEPQKLWRLVGAQGGYSALCKLWVWYDAPDVDGLDEKNMSKESWWMLQSIALNRMTRGAIKNFDLVNLIGKYTDSERLRVDSARGDSTSDQMALMALELLKLASPKVLEISRTIDQTAAINAKLDEKRQAAKLTTDELSDTSGFGKVNIKDYLAQKFTK